MRLAWFMPQDETTTGEVVLAATPDELREVVLAASPDEQRPVVAGPGGAGVAWWIPTQHEPTMTEAAGRLEFLRRHGTSPYAFGPSDPQPPLSIRPVWLDDVDVQLLISQLNMDLYSRYPEPGALVFSLEAADIEPGVGALLMAELDHEPVGCGAYRIVDEQPGWAEMKRLYVTLAGRGKKIGRAILAELERVASAHGAERFVLETGPRQPEAQRVFESSGYVVREPWGRFVGKELSICMEKLRST